VKQIKPLGQGISSVHRGAVLNTNGSSASFSAHIPLPRSDSSMLLEELIDMISSSVSIVLQGTISAVSSISSWVALSLKPTSVKQNRPSGQGWLSKHRGAVLNDNGSSSSVTAQSPGPDDGEDVGDSVATDSLSVTSAEKHRSPSGQTDTRERTSKLYVG
jgi:hypothetical protein